MSDDALPHSEIILYQTEDGRTRIQCRFENETVWLTQAQIAELFENSKIFPDDMLSEAHIGKILKDVVRRHGEK